MPTRQKSMFAGAVVFLLLISLCSAAITARRAPTNLYPFELSDQDVVEIGQALDRRHVDYQVDPSGKHIMVSPSVARPVRLRLALEGLPRDSKEVGELTSMSTDEDRKRHRQRALEAELAETIGLLEEVRSARVSLALPPETYFKNDTLPATAAVYLNFRPGAKLVGGQVTGLAHLVSASVPGLSPEKVAIVGPDGTLLEEAKPLSEDELESRLAGRTQAMLDDIYGKHRSKLLVRIEFDHSKQETRRKDIGGPEHTTLEVGGKSKREKFQKSSEEPSYESETEAHKIIYDELYFLRVIDKPRIAKVSCAVAVDNFQVDQLEKVKNLVAQAVGIDESRGDSIAVESVPFSHPAGTVLEPPAPQPASGLDNVSLASIFLGLTLAGVVGLFLGLRPRPKTPTITDQLENLGITQVADLHQKPGGQNTYNDPCTAVNNHQTLEQIVRDNPEEAARRLKRTLLS